MSGEGNQDEMRPQLENQNDTLILGNMAVSPEKEATTSGDHNTASAVPETPSVQQPGETCENAVQSLNQSQCNEKTPSQPRKRKSTSGSPISSTRLLRSKSKEKSGTLETNKPVVIQDASEEKKRKRRKKKSSKHIVVDEFSRIKGHLRYLLHRITYEQTLIEAYSGEGWKGQSLEKIKLEKELHRAKTHIFRYKLKIRDLFQRLDTLLDQGRIPASSFDDEGEIDSEDIFCAKCGSKDLLLDNDIILCDGVCERGFHQFCLEPPLLKEDIPPDEEGWLCPGCDCKVDCIDLLNDLQGTDISITDSWEKVFPKEAAAAASAGKLEDISGLPSDDSEDDDYNPDNPDMAKNNSGDESSFDESDFFSASEDLGEAPPKDDEFLGLPSEDSEDDDYNPNDPDKDEDEPVKTESSSSDFSSDSEDLSLVVDTSRLPRDDSGVSCSVDDHRPNWVSEEEKGKVGKAKRSSLKDELAYLVQSDGLLVAGKRPLERLDYKKLHDETYGDVSSDSSDEDFVDGPSPKVRKIRSAKAAIASPSSTAQDTKFQCRGQKGSRHIPDGLLHEKFKVGGSDNSNSRSSSKKKAYGEYAIKRLYECFKENQFPDRDTKENLGKELGLTANQVRKWFENARFSYRHSSCWDSNMSHKMSEGSPSPQKKGETLATEPESIRNDASCIGVDKLEPPNSSQNGENGLPMDENDGHLMTPEGSGKKSGTSEVKNDTTGQVLDGASSCMISKHNAHVDIQNSLEGIGKNSRNSMAKNETTGQISDGPASSICSTKQNTEVDTPNCLKGSEKNPRKSKAKNDTTGQASDGTPSSGSSMKLNVQADTPNSQQHVRRSSRLQDRSNSAAT